MLVGTGFFGVMQCSKIDYGDGCAALEMYQNHGIVQLKQVTLWYINYMSTKLF